MRGRSIRGAARSWLLLACALGWATPAGAQAPGEDFAPPVLPPDEKDFEGLTSLNLGSGARAFGMGGAFLARADDATAASWNPAGLSYLRRPELTVVGARTGFDRGLSGQPATDRFLGYTPDFAAATWPIEPGPLPGAIQVSFQRVFSFHGEREVVRESPTTVFTTEGRGGFDVLALGTGLRLTRWLRIGGTLNRWMNGYHQSRRRSGVPRGRGPAQQEIDYELSGWSANLGLIWSPVESLNVGAVGKTPFTGTLFLTRERIDSATTPPTPESTSRNVAGPLRARLAFPGAVGVGASWRPRSALTLSADYTRTFWAEGRIYGFYVLPQTPLGQAPPPPEVFPELPYPTLDDPVQFDTEQLRIGGEYVFLGRRVKWPIRAGYFTDRQYFADGAGRVPRFRGFTVGTGVLAGPLLFDVAYVRETGTYLDTETPPSRVTTRVNRVFVSLIYRYSGP